MTPMNIKIRDHLSSGDLEFVLGTLGGSEGEKDALLSLLADPHESVAILDHECLLQAVLETTGHLPITPRPLLYLLWAQVPAQRGLERPGPGRLRGLRPGGVLQHRPRSGPVPELLYSVDLLEQVQKATAYERFFIYSAAGNRYLFRRASFPGFLERRERRWGAPGLGYYEQVARSSFKAAAEHPLAREFALESVYGILAHRFREMRCVLNGFSDSLVTLN
jgi:hypothetical protein